MTFQSRSVPDDPDHFCDVGRKLSTKILMGATHEELHGVGGPEGALVGAPGAHKVHGKKLLPHLGDNLLGS